MHRLFLICVILAVIPTFESRMVAEEPVASLPPGMMLLPESALPSYESEIDHAGLIRAWDKNSLKLGRELYQQVCHNCHGDLNQPGSIPNSLRFGDGVFQHGNDPYTMYQTITRGWRQMVPQVQLVPREKYAIIHYIRESFLKEHNGTQLFSVTDGYLAGLPKGNSKGPNPVKREPWREMDYGRFLIGTFEIATPEKRAKPWPKGEQPDYVSPDANLAHKAIAIRLDSGEGGVAAGKTWLAFEHDTLRVAGVWAGEGFIDWHGINFDGRHVERPRTLGEPILETSNAPGWANPETGKFDDPRITGLDGRRYGPLPREWGHFNGIYRHGNRIVISYSIGQAEILDCAWMPFDGVPVVARSLNIGASSHDLILRVGNAGVNVHIQGTDAVKLSQADGFQLATIPAAVTPLNFVLYLGKSDPDDLEMAARKDEGALLDLAPLTTGGPAQWPDSIETGIVRGNQPGPFQWDSLTPPVANPWKSRLRTSGLDFTADGKAAIVCCWDGDVWRVEGIGDDKAATVRWRRIASGLFQPLGVKLVGDSIFVTCRDQIVRLRDLNGDGETDFYENFNSDHLVTEHFHEFAMGLQADADGNLYYAKSARHARTPLVPHHGTLLKVSADGSKTEILANGFRAANGVCLNPDGTFIVTDQEGHWNPMNRVNWVEPGGHFYGNMWSYGAPADSSDLAMDPPLCWVDKGFDRSPSELLWIESERWGSLNGRLLNLSYGHGRLEIVPHETVNGVKQGGLCRLPIPDFPTGVMRGRFHPRDGHLYLCGMSAWGTAQMQLPGGLYRIRATGLPAHLPVDLHAREGGIDITFSDPLAPDSVADLKRFNVRTWALQRSANYGSKHYDEKKLLVEAATLSSDGLTLSLSLPEIEPVWQMAIQYRLVGADGEEFEGELQNTIHVLGKAVGP